MSRLRHLQLLNRMERPTLSVSIRQLTPVFAGEVTGVNCREPLSPDEVAAIHAGMNEYAVLVFRDQKLTDEEQLQFTLHFGAIETAEAVRLGTFISGPIRRCGSWAPASWISERRTFRKNLVTR